MPILPFKLNQGRRRYIPKQKHKVINWRAYDASLRQRGSLTVWFTDEAIEAWFRIWHFWVTQCAWKPPACEGQISDTWLFVAGGDQPSRVKLAGAEAVLGLAGSASADGLGRSSTPAGPCPGARHAGCA